MAIAHTVNQARRTDVAQPYSGRDSVATLVREGREEMSKAACFRRLLEAGATELSTAGGGISGVLHTAKCSQHFAILFRAGEPICVAAGRSTGRLWRVLGYDCRSRYRQ